MEIKEPNSTIMKCDYVIVGAGITGLISSIILAEKGYDVVIIERANKVGGLLSSYKAATGVEYDYGTHVPQLTGLEALDKIAFSMLSKEKWHYHEILKPANFFNGKMYKTSQLINLKDLPKELYKKAIIELLSSTQEEKDFENEEAFLYAKYGKTVTDAIVRPLLSKLLGADLSNLAPGAHKLFGYTRFVPGDGHMSRELKKSAYYDNIFAFADFHEGVSALTKFYPKENGVGQWVEALATEARKRGVKILLETSVAKMTPIDERNKIVIECKGDLKIEAKKLVWSLAPAILTWYLPGDYIKVPVTFRSSHLYHFEYDMPFDIDNYFVYCNDWNYRSFRITLYPNLQLRHKKAPFNLTIELMGDTDLNEKEEVELLTKEMCQMGITNPDAKLLNWERLSLKNGFPIFTNEMVNSQKQLVEEIQKRNPSVLLIGRATGKSFFMHHVMQDTYRTLESIPPKKEAF